MNKVVLKLKFKNGHIERREIEYFENTLKLTMSEIEDSVDYIEVFSSYFSATCGGNGFFVIPNIQEDAADNNCHGALTFFNERSDTESVFPANLMPVYAVSSGDKATLAIVTGMSLDYSLVCGVKNGKYYLYPRFILDGEAPYESIEIKFFHLEESEASYSGIARRYRQYQLEHGACKTIRERMKEHPVVGEATKGPEVRLRLGWKPVPPPVLEQTEENEPPMHVAITFDRAGEIIDEFHKHGIENAEFCLVGWNKSGHDGRFPDNLPVEPLLGGEKSLKRLVNKARKYGYLICGHTNVMDAYSIAERWNREDILVEKNGQIEVGGCWGGGQAYVLCPKQAHEQNAIQDFEDMAHLGFRGTHYLDVLSILRPKACYHPEHPLTRREAGKWRGNSLALAREKIGASGSEGAWDFCIGSLDYVLYAVFNPQHKLPRICDNIIPFWHLVYHGIVLYNSSCETVNTAVNPDRKAWLKNVEYGGRPLVYFYAKFLSSGRNWMGKVDCGCSTDDELRSCVTKIKREYDEFKTLRDLQFEFMEEHMELEDGVVKVRYSNGKTVIVNYNDYSYRLNSKKIEALDFLIV